MNPIFASLLDQLPVYGPWIVLVLGILETSFVTGLAFSPGLATSAATVLALEGRLELAPIVVAALAGGALGDSIGFWIGRLWGTRLMATDSRWSRMLGDRRPVLDELFGRHPIYSVTVARLISFVRTLMPLAAGMSGLSYRRFLPYQLIGLLGWLPIYLGIGYFARESWELATQLVGVGGTVAFVVFGVIAWRFWKRRAAVERQAGAGAA